MMRVRVYRNVRTGQYSILNPKTGRVIARRDEVALSNVEFKVSEAGRQRTLARSQKTVHAFAVGDLLLKKDVKRLRRSCRENVRYDPYLAGYFFRSADHEAVSCAKAAVLLPTGLFIKE